MIRFYASLYDRLVSDRQIFPQRILTDWRLRTRSLALGARTLVMGVVNITPDSFSDGGLYLETDAAVEHALQLLEEGADLLDLGAESTRPGVRAGGADAAVSADEEQDRLLPVIEGILKRRPDAVLSVDTYKAATARAAVAAGAEIVNDVSGFTWDDGMAAACAQLRCGVVLTHTRGRPGQWRDQPALSSAAVLPLVRDGLAANLDAALTIGVLRESVLLDPGYGFGKRLDENYDLLVQQAALLELGRPLLVGLSRKSFLGGAGGAQGGRTPGLKTARDAASLAALTAAILLGASVVRVHAVLPSVGAARIADAVCAAARQQ